MTKACKAISEIFPPKPSFTEKNLGDLTGKVFIVTGGYSGIGLELVKVLYPTNATIYIAGRSLTSASSAIASIKAAAGSDRNTLHTLVLDLSDLTTIRPAAEEFLQRETRLDVLWLNAGVMQPPAGSKTTQGYELQLGTNALGHFLFAKLLTPLLQATAKGAAAPPRVVWTTSNAAAMAPSNGGINWGDINYTGGGGAWEIYGQSKAAIVILAKEFARRYGGDGVRSVSMHPGFLKTGLQRHWGSVQTTMASAILLKEPWYGAMTLLWSGLSPEVLEGVNGAYVFPWGRFGETRKDVWEADGSKLWAWCEDQVSKY